MKQEFEMLQSEMDEIIRINKATPNAVMMVGGVDFSNNLREAINHYWQILGDKYGFKWDTVEGSSKGNLFFLAESKPKVVPKTQTEIEIEKYNGEAFGYLNLNVKNCLRKITTQLESCNYENEAGFLNNNIAFLALKGMCE